MNLLLARGRAGPARNPKSDHRSNVGASLVGALGSGSGEPARLRSSIGVGGDEERACGMQDKVVYMDRNRTRNFRLALAGVLTAALLVFGAVSTVLAAPADYDANGNGRIERDEVVLAIKDYFAGNIERDEVVEVIKLYFSGANVESAPNLELSALSLSYGSPAVHVELSPSFTPAADTYTANVTSDVSSVTVHAIPSGANVTVAIRIGGVEDADGTVELLEGTNVIEVEVMAQDGVNSRIYTVTVDREAAPAVNLMLDVGEHRVAGYWSDGTADVAGTVTLSVVGGGQGTEAQPVVVTCADYDGMRPELCHWRTDLLGDGLTTASTEFRVRVPTGLVKLVFTSGGINSTEETLEREVYAPERIVGVSREEWDCYVDRTLDTTQEDVTGNRSFYGCSGWSSENQVHKLKSTRSVVLWATGDGRYIDILRETVDELTPMLNHDVKWTSNESQATFKAYVGIPREEWATYGLTGITTGLLNAAGFARSTTKTNGEVIPKEIVVWRTEREWVSATPAFAKHVIIHELLHALTGVSHVSGRTASMMGYSSDIPKLSPMDEALFNLNSHRLVRPGMNMSRVSDLVVYDEDLLDESPPKPGPLELLWRAAIQLVDSGAVRFHLRGGWIDECNLPFGTASDTVTLDIGDFRGFLLSGIETARYQDSSGIYWMAWSTEDLEWQFWTEKGGSVERVSRDAVTDALLWMVWPHKLQRTLYTLISDWDPKDVAVSRRDETLTLQVTLDDSYESIWASERFRSLDLTMLIDAETNQLESYEWKYRFNPSSEYCETYEEVAQSIDLGIDFTVPQEVAAVTTGRGSDESQLFETTAPVVPKIRRPEAP